MACIKLTTVFAICLGIVSEGSAQESTWNDLNKQVLKLIEEGKYAEETSIGERALKVATQDFGSNDRRVAAALNNLALVYDKQGRYAEAEPLYKRSLAIRTKAAGTAK